MRCVPCLVRIDRLRGDPGQLRLLFDQLPLSLSVRRFVLNALFSQFGDPLTQPLVLHKRGVAPFLRLFQAALQPENLLGKRLVVGPRFVDTTHLLPQVPDVLVHDLKLFVQLLDTSPLKLTRACIGVTRILKLHHMGLRCSGIAAPFLALLDPQFFHEVRIVRPQLLDCRSGRLHCRILRLPESRRPVQPCSLPRFGRLR
mmetsp:Transcript_36622/g.117588  ORF Transcript_36622/g.117588 Transcript_36622/m.117588 type:complete len:200 (-) Transcript_36622:78-677(-)